MYQAETKPQQKNTEKLFLLMFTMVFNYKKYIVNVFLMKATTHVKPDSDFRNQIKKFFRNKNNKYECLGWVNGLGLPCLVAPPPRFI